MDTRNKEEVADMAMLLMAERLEFEGLFPGQDRLQDLMQDLWCARQGYEFEHPELIQLLRTGLHLDVAEIRIHGRGIALAHPLPSQEQVNNAKATLKEMRDAGLYFGDL